jgi:hypothetical protein
MIRLPANAGEDVTQFSVWNVQSVLPSAADTAVMLPSFEPK